MHTKQIKHTGLFQDLKNNQRTYHLIQNISTITSYLNQKAKQVNKTSLLDPRRQIGNKPAHGISLPTEKNTMSSDCFQWLTHWLTHWTYFFKGQLKSMPSIAHN